MPTIQKLTALEILDSRGRPTIKASCHLSSGLYGSASVPSGASTGSAEALELRDGDTSRYGGLGCRKAVGNITREINDVLQGRSWNQAALDGAMVELDGTPNKARLGANAILAVSLAFARAAAADLGTPLYGYFAQLVGEPIRTLPRPTVNLFSGGKHAGGQVAIQDVLVVPLQASTMDECLAVVYAVYSAAVALVEKKYGMRLLRADEGGLAPPCPSPELMIEDAVEAIRNAGLRPGRDVALAVDIASSHFYHPSPSPVPSNAENGMPGAERPADITPHPTPPHFATPTNSQFPTPTPPQISTPTHSHTPPSPGGYFLGDQALDSPGMIRRLGEWVNQYPVLSVEDGLSEEDWDHWPLLRAAMEKQVLVVGDDFLCTNPGRIQRAIETKAANALLLKVNQVGSLTEAARALQLARSAGWQITVSARSGETEDNWLADLAVGWAGEAIKIGSITQSERLAKYNRLLEIEEEEGLPVAHWAHLA